MNINTPFGRDHKTWQERFDDIDAFLTEYRSRTR